MSRLPAQQSLSQIFKLIVSYREKLLDSVNLVMSRQVTKEKKKLTSTSCHLWMKNITCLSSQTLHLKIQNRKGGGGGGSVDTDGASLTL